VLPAAAASLAHHLQHELNRRERILEIMRRQRQQHSLVGDGATRSLVLNASLERDGSSPRELGRESEIGSRVASTRMFGRHERETSQHTATPRHRDDHRGRRSHAAEEPDMSRVASYQLEPMFIHVPPIGHAGHLNTVRRMPARKQLILAASGSSKEREQLASCVRRAHGRAQLRRQPGVNSKYAEVGDLRHHDTKHDRLQLIDARRVVERHGRLRQETPVGEIEPAVTVG
jgi:hypothetical protein